MRQLFWVMHTLLQQIGSQRCTETLCNLKICHKDSPVHKAMQIFLIAASAVLTKSSFALFVAQCSIVVFLVYVDVFNNFHHCFFFFVIEDLAQLRLKFD